VFGVAGPAPDDARSGGVRGGHPRETRRDAKCAKGEEREWSKNEREEGRGIQTDRNCEYK
jgi:hypothetical protein